MGQFTVRTKEQILERMINRTVARSDLTDVNDGSSVKQVLAAAAREDDDQYYQMQNLQDLFDLSKVSGPDLDERLKEFNPLIITRNLAVKATGEVVFSRQGTAGVVTIPVGARVQVPATETQAALVFVTTEEGVIPDLSQDSNSVDVTAVEAGTDYNVAPTAISAFESKPVGVDTVSNAAAITNGANKESDDALRTRVQSLINGLARAHVTGLFFAALTGEDAASGKTVQFAHVVEDVVNRGEVIVYIDDGSGSLGSDVDTETGQIILASAAGGEVDLVVPNVPIKPGTTFNLYVDVGGGPVLKTEGTDYNVHRPDGRIKLTQASYPDGLDANDEVSVDYTYFTGLVAEVQKIIDGDTSDRTNYPGYRAGGVSVAVLPPSVQYPVVTVNITLKQGFNQTAVAAQVTAALSDYVNSLGISDDVILNELRERTMAVAGMYDCNFQLPTSNIVILDNQIARLIVSNLTVS